MGSSPRFEVVGCSRESHVRRDDLDGKNVREGAGEVVGILLEKKIIKSGRGKTH